jgi:hypothetical protein
MTRIRSFLSVIHLHQNPSEPSNREWLSCKAELKERKRPQKGRSIKDEKEADEK